MIHTGRLAACTLGAGIALAYALVACADSSSDIGQGEDGTQPAPSSASTAQLPPPSNSGGAKDAGGTSSGSSGSSGASSSSGSSGASSSGSTSSGSTSSGSSSGGALATCTFDPAALITKLAELQSAGPCDATCDPKTHCCLDLLGGSSGGSGGLPIDAGGGSSTGGLPSTGKCMTK